MSRVLLLASLATITLGAGSWVMACSSSSATPGGNDGGPPPTSEGGSPEAGGDAAPASGFALGVACTDSIDSVYGDPGTLPADKGAIIKCAVDTPIKMADVQSKLAADQSLDAPPATNQAYTGKPMTSGAITYRILYRTERGDSANSPGYSSAKVFVPDTPRASGKLPLLVGARGSRGQAAQCTASKEDPVGVYINGDYDALGLPMVGLGLPIIIPDLAGYANYGAAGNPPSVYAGSQDVGKSTLDGARALAKMFPYAFNGKVVVIGHSQGGHSALSSVAIQSAYAPDLSIAAVALYSPLWFSQRSWGALLFEASYYPLAVTPSPNVVSIWYHYTHGELLDGPGHGLDVFSNANDGGIKAAIKHFVDTDCWDMGYDGTDAGTAYPDLQAIATTASDLFDQNFAISIEKAAAGVGTGQCAAGDALCQKWMQRYADDRPHLSNTPPILIEYGTNDTTIPPGQMACAIDRLKNQDHVPYNFCLIPGVGHQGVVRQQASYVADWIASQTLGEPAPTACAMTDANLTDDAGTPIPCATPPPNN